MDKDIVQKYIDLWIEWKVTQKKKINLSSRAITSLWNGILDISIYQLSLKDWENYEYRKYRYLGTVREGKCKEIRNKYFVQAKTFTDSIFDSEEKLCEYLISSNCNLSEINWIWVYTINEVKELIKKVYSIK